MSKNYLLAFVLLLSSFSAVSQHTFTSYRNSGGTAESVPTNTAIADSGFVYIMPFNEDFNTGLFQTNEWIAESDNWMIQGQLGNQAPSASFHYSPLVTNYSSSLISPWIGATGLIDGQIFLKFDLKKQITNPTLTENLYLDVFDGTGWIQKSLFTNDANTTWVPIKVDITDEALGHTFKIRFRAEGANSMNMVDWLIDNIEVYRKCAAPYDFFVDYTSPMHPCKVKLEWENPITPIPNNAWLQYDNGTNSDVIGLTDGGTFLVAVRFTPAQLYQYIGTNLTKIKLFPYSTGGEIILKVWTGNNASTLERSQVITSYTAGQWNEFSLNQPFEINATQELWFGYEITHAGGQYIAGVDAGPANEGYGDLISTDGIVWESMSNSYNLDHNWNLQGFVTNSKNPRQSNSGRSLVHFNVYRDELLLATTTETEYYDNLELINHQVCYNVSAVYDECESDHSNTDCPWYCHESAVDDHDITKIELYPNPASSMVTVDITGEISNLIITDITGRKLQQHTIAPGTISLPVDVSEFPEGIYVVRFITKTGESGVRKFVK